MALDERVSNYLDAFEAAVAQYGPQAADFALLYVRVDSGVKAVGGVALLVLAAFLARYSWKAWQAAPKDYADDPLWPWPIYIVFSGVAAMFAVGGGVWFSFNPWNWIGIFAPQLKLVHDAIKMIGN